MVLRGIPASHALVRKCWRHIACSFAFTYGDGAGGWPSASQCLVIDSIESFLTDHPICSSCRFLVVVWLGELFTANSTYSWSLAELSSHSIFHLSTNGLFERVERASMTSIIELALTLRYVGVVPVLQIWRSSEAAKPDSIEPLASSLGDSHSAECELKSPATMRSVSCVVWFRMEASKPLRKRSKSWMVQFGMQ